MQDTTREEKSDSQLDSSGVMRKHEAGKGTATEGWRQAVPQRWRKKQQGERKSDSRKKEKEQDRDQHRGTGSRMEVQKKPATGSMTERKEKRIGAGT